MTNSVARQAIRRAKAEPSAIKGGQKLTANVPPAQTRSGYGVIVYQTQIGMYQLVLTHRRCANFNNPPEHGGDAGYLCFKDERAAVMALQLLASSDDPAKDRRDINQHIRLIGEDGFFHAHRTRIKV